MVLPNGRAPRSSPANHHPVLPQNPPFMMFRVACVLGPKLRLTPRLLREMGRGERERTWERNQENAQNCAGDQDDDATNPSRFRKQRRADKQTRGITFRARRREGRSAGHSFFHPPRGPRHSRHSTNASAFLRSCSHLLR